MNSINDLTSSTAAPLGSAPAAPSTALGKEEFMKLLLAQLKAQDPLNPMQSTEFVSQLSQFASLEQLTNLGKRIDDLVTISGASNAANAVSLLGKDVRVASNSITGPGSVFYKFDHEAQNAKMIVKDETGHIVKTFE